MPDPDHPASRASLKGTELSGPQERLSAIAPLSTNFVADNARLFVDVIQWAGDAAGFYERLLALTTACTLELRRAANDDLTLPHLRSLAQQTLLWPALGSPFEALNALAGKDLKKLQMGAMFNLANKKKFSAPKLVAMEVIQVLEKWRTSGFLQGGTGFGRASYCPSALPKYGRNTVDDWRQAVDLYMNVELAPPEYRCKARQKIPPSQLVEPHPSVPGEIPPVPAKVPDLPSGPLLRRQYVAEYCRKALAASTKPTPNSQFDAFKRRVLEEVFNLAPLESKPAPG